jgi:surfactin synthase thioesterase subunit
MLVRESFAVIHLFCFPHAGASAATYVRWRQHLPEWIRVSPVELPGRGRRAREPLQTSFAALLAQLEHEVQPGPGQTFAFFGHSLGALLAFELAWQRWRSGASLPSLVMVAGAAAPCRREPERYARTLSDAELRAELAQLGGTPQSVLENAELMELALPILRADFQVAGEYRCAEAHHIPAPIQVFAGAEDATTAESLSAWQLHTQGSCRVDVLPGGHFFVQRQEACLLPLLVQRLSQSLAAA